MSKDIKSDHKHLTLSDRIYIEQALIRGDNFEDDCPGTWQRSDNDLAGNQKVS